MAKTKLTIALLASTALLGVSAQAGVGWNNGTYMQAMSLTQPNLPTYVSSGLCSYYYSAAQSAAHRATVFAAYPDLVFGNPQTAVAVEHVPVGSTMRLHVTISNLGASSALDFYSLTPLPYYTGTETAAAQHAIIFYWDANAQALVMQLDGNRMAVDSSLGGIFGDPFQAPINGDGWTVGAKLVLSGANLVPTQFFQGSADQVFCHFDDNPPSGPNDFQKISTPGLIPPAYMFPISFIYDPQTQTKTGPYPNPLGPFCTEVFTPQAPFPYLCLRGNVNTFPQNDGLGAFTVIPANGLTNAPFSPWDLAP